MSEFTWGSSLWVLSAAGVALSTLVTPFSRPAVCMNKHAKLAHMYYSIETDSIARE